MKEHPEWEVCKGKIRERVSKRTVSADEVVKRIARAERERERLQASLEILGDLVHEYTRSVLRPR